MGRDDMEQPDVAWSVAHGQLAPEQVEAAASSSAELVVGPVHVFALARSDRSPDARSEAERAVAAALSAAATMLPAIDHDLDAVQPALVRGVLNRWRQDDGDRVPQGGAGTSLLIALVGPDLARVIGFGSGTAAVVTPRDVVLLEAEAEAQPPAPPEPPDQFDPFDDDEPWEPSPQGTGLDHGDAAAHVRSQRVRDPVLVWLSSEPMPADTSTDPPLAPALVHIAEHLHRDADEPRDEDGTTSADGVPASLPDWLADEAPFVTGQVLMSWSATWPLKQAAAKRPSRAVPAAAAARPRRPAPSTQSTHRARAAAISLMAVLGIVGSTWALANWQREQPQVSPTLQPSPTPPTPQAPNSDPDPDDHNTFSLPFADPVKHAVAQHDTDPHAETNRRPHAPATGADPHAQHPGAPDEHTHAQLIESNPIAEPSDHITQPGAGAHPDHRGSCQRAVKIRVCPSAWPGPTMTGPSKK